MDGGGDDDDIDFVIEALSSVDIRSPSRRDADWSIDSSESSMVYCDDRPHNRQHIRFSDSTMPYDGGGGDDDDDNDAHELFGSRNQAGGTLGDSNRTETAPFHLPQSADFAGKASAQDTSSVVEIYRELANLHTMIRKRHRELAKSQRASTLPFVQMISIISRCLTAEQWAKVAHEILPLLPSLAEVHPGSVCMIACRGRMFDQSLQDSQLASAHSMLLKCAVRALEIDSADVYAIHIAASLSSHHAVLRKTLSSLETLLISNPQKRVSWFGIAGSLDTVFRCATHFKTMAVVKPAIGCLLAAISVEKGMFLKLAKEQIYSRPCIRALCENISRGMCVEECSVILQKLCASVKSDQGRNQLRLIFEAEGVPATLSNLVTSGVASEFASQQIESISRILKS
eukprot:ANDGO_03113.mRNA.1 hypothetical protein